MYTFGHDVGGDGFSRYTLYRQHTLGGNLKRVSEKGSFLTARFLALYRQTVAMSLDFRLYVLRSAFSTRI